MSPSAVDIRIASNGHANGQANGFSNGHTNGHTNNYANGQINGRTNGHIDSYTTYEDGSVSHYSDPSHRSRPQLFEKAADDEVHDLLCVGFGPASLAIAVALHDKVEARAIQSPKVRFLERQQKFGWHAGMLLEGTKMQISFIKDLATLRDPRSHFTFLNYLQEHNRLVQFSNLDTFLPFRVEFEDYLKWVASHFEHVAKYSQDVQSIRPVKHAGSDKYDCMEVVTKNLLTGEITKLLGRNVVIAVGGRPVRPQLFPEGMDRVIHSSQYKHQIANLLPNSGKSYNIAVVGSGQSAAEVFNDLHSRYPNAKTQMVIRDTAIRPSDDSPFVNEVFDPEAVNEFFNLPPVARARVLLRNKATNYSVVRLNLIEKIYEDLYHQYMQQPDKEKWQHRILPTREIVEVNEIPQSKKLNMILKNMNPTATKTRDNLSLDAVVLATGYQRNVHLDMLKDCQMINGAADGQWLAGRDYQVELDREFVNHDVGIWLQGCNEVTHGLADSLLSILATRSGELVDAMFGHRKVVNGSTKLRQY